MYSEKINCRETALICKLAQIVLHINRRKTQIHLLQKGGVYYE